MLGLVQVGQEKAMKAVINGQRLHSRDEILRKKKNDSRPEYAVGPRGPIYISKVQFLKHLSIAIMSAFPPRSEKIPSTPIGGGRLSELCW